MNTNADQAQTGQESQLLEHIEQARRSPEGRGAVFIHFSRLRRQNRREHHLRIALDVFEARVKSLSGQIFTLSDGDLVFLWRGEVEPIDDAVQQVCHLFSDDPLSHVGGTDDRQRFCTWFDLDDDGGEALQETVQKVLAECAETRKFGPKKPAEANRVPLTPRLLEELEKSLAQADMTNMMRRQPICVLAPGEKPQTVLQELYIYIGDLEGSLAEKVDLTSDPWLFQRLTLTLDRRMLALMERHDDTSIARYFSLNINVTTLLDPVFLKFDAGVRSDARGTIVLEVPILEIFRDVAAFAFARDFVRERGYRICADGVSQFISPFVDRDALGLDLVKLHWSPEMLDDPTGKRRQAMADCVARCGANRIILCRCDDPQAVAFGINMGIAMFQGRGVDSIISSGAVIPGAAAKITKKAAGA